jgi:CRISPR-associated endonuclease/helicase Cas3
MNQEFLAHSARRDRGIPSQRYWDHVKNVVNSASDKADKASMYWRGDRSLFCSSVIAAAHVHDCGKLADENQLVLRTSSSRSLPVRHEDAGVAWLLQHKSELSALLVASHHAGLPSLSLERKKLLENPRGEMFRITSALEHTRQHLPRFIHDYETAGFHLTQTAKDSTEQWSGLAKRLALSCLVDADHTDTAIHYQHHGEVLLPETRWRERLDALDRHVNCLQEKNRGDARSKQRSLVYQSCRQAELDPPLRSCESSVGSGKTTAVMAHLLQVAQAKGLRRILVVLPYVNIIRQSVEIYRRSLVLPGENPEEIVAELHHQADFQSPESRGLAALWKAPVIVTTAVQFFETIAANRPRHLRKLHELPGSGIFVDEAHAAIPVWLWPQTWLWLRELTNDWGCHAVLASGSLTRFWQLKQIVTPPESVLDLLSPELQHSLNETETVRIVAKRKFESMNLEELEQFVLNQPGPRLVILNTVQSAAVLADRMYNDGHDVLHLSTALTPVDRDHTIEIVRRRLKDPNDTQWSLVATSCVEAGVDFSFRTGIRESCSIASVIQTGGRVNRDGRWSESRLWVVKLLDPLFNEHPAFRASRQVLEEMSQEGWLDGKPAAEAVTQALRRELILRDIQQKSAELKKKEERKEYAEVASLYRVIEADSHTVIVKPELISALEAYQPVSSREILRNSVQLWTYKIELLRLQAFAQHPELYKWNGQYNDFLGYMADVLPLIRAKQTGVHII